MLDVSSPIHLYQIVFRRGKKTLKLNKMRIDNGTNKIQVKNLGMQTVTSNNMYMYVKCSGTQSDWRGIFHSENMNFHEAITTKPLHMNGFMEAEEVYAPFRLERLQNSIHF